MSRRKSGSIAKRAVQTDPKYGSELVAHMINYFMRRGKKTTAQRIVYGAVAELDGKVEGFIYGCPLNDDTFDASVGKVNRRQWKDLYPLLYREFARRCAKGYRWLNWEEDLGSEGLRKMKLSYRPDHLIEKYIVTEI